MTAQYKVHRNVAVITLNNPPVNGLGYATRRAIVKGLERGLASSTVKAIVITGAGKAFSGGADIKEFGSPKAVQEPNLLSRHQGHRKRDQTGGCGDAFGRHGRRTGAIAGLPLPHRRAWLQGCVARGQARAHSRRGRDAAFAARIGRRGRAEHDRQW